MSIKSFTSFIFGQVDDVPMFKVDEERAKRLRKRLAERKMEMGAKYIGHPSNYVKRKDARK